MRLLFKWVIYIAIIILGVSFAALNAGNVSVNLYLTKLSIPIAVLVAATLGVGLVGGGLISLVRYWRLKLELIKIKNQLKISEKEVKNLRDIPLKDTH